ncbi:MAG: (Fe-S)-binding protein, partial [Calditrichia bacterium]|nr:(Fe-S)-binding protein [Calditrichia bacterium]
VSHISEFLAEKLEEKNVKIKTENQKITFQDPCRLGRHLGIYEAPRKAIEYLEGYELKEMGRNKKRGICCGVTCWMNCSQVSKKIQVQRLQEAKATGADTLVTSCAKCKIHFQCALSDKELSKDIDMDIKDLTEIFAENL